MTDSEKDLQEYNAAVLAVLGSSLMLGTRTDESKDRFAAVVAQYGVAEDWFRDVTSRMVWRAIMKANQDHGTTDPIVVLDMVSVMDGDRTAAVSLIESAVDSVQTTANFEYYCHALKGHYSVGVLRRKMLECMKKLRPQTWEMTLEDHLRDCTNMSESVTREQGREGLTLAYYMAGSIEKKRRLHEERFVKHNWEYLDGLPFPWHECNQIFSGLKTGLHVLGALASQGKSLLAADISTHWSQKGIPHAYFSIDMAADQMADRYPCIEGRVSLAKLNFGGSADDVAKFEQAFQKVAARGNVWFHEESNVEQIRSIVKYGIRKHGWKAIIIDYLQLLTAAEKSAMPEYTRVQRVVQVAKEIAKAEKIPVIALAQLSRAFEKELREQMSKPGLDAIGDSAEIARAAASVTVLYQDEDMKRYWAQNPPVKLAFADPLDMLYKYGVTSYGQETDAERESRRKGQLSLAKNLRPVWFDVLKNQQGGLGKVPFVMFPNYFLLRPGNSEGGDQEVDIGKDKKKKLPVGKFEQICDDWTYTEQDWWLQMTGVMPRRGCKLMGETYGQMYGRMERDRLAHPEVKHFVFERDDNLKITGWKYYDVDGVVIKKSDFVL